MKKEKDNNHPRPAHSVEITQKNGLFFVTIDGQELVRRKKSRPGRVAYPTPETFLTSESALKAAEKAIARQRKQAEQ